MKDPSKNGIRQGSLSIMSSSTPDFEKAMNSLDPKCPMEVANEINRLALMEHFMFNNPQEAMQLHLAAIDLKMECSKRLDLIVEAVDDFLLHEKKKNFASEIVITLIDLGNCFWSISQIDKSKLAYDSAKLICRLMDIRSKLLETSLSNRLSKLRLLKDVESINDGIGDETCAECIDSFERSMYITKNTAARLTSAMLIDSKARNEKKSAG